MDEDVSGPYEEDLLIPIHSPIHAKRTMFREVLGAVGGSEPVFASMFSEVLIYYGSNTGTAKQYARTLAKDIAARGIRVEMASLDTFDEAVTFTPSQFSLERAFVFVVATYGAGGPTPSAERFHEWLSMPMSPNAPEPALPLAVVTAGGSNNPEYRSILVRLKTTMHLMWQRTATILEKKRQSQRKRTGGPLMGMQYTVFGIGDSHYLTFNGMGKFVDNQLQLLGATRMCAMGVGDVAGDIESAFLLWKNHLLHKLPMLSELPNPAGRPGSTADSHNSVISQSRISVASEREVIDKMTYRSKLRLQCTMLTEAEAQQHLLAGSSSSKDADEDRSFKRARSSRGNALLRRPNASIASVRLHGSKDGHYRVALVRLEILSSDFMYEAGDAVALIPHNSPEVVEEVAFRLQFDLDSWFDLHFSETRDKHHHRQNLPFNTPCSVRKALTEYLDLHTISREFLRVASSYTTVARERETLERLASADGSEEFSKHFVRQRKGLLDLLTLAPSLYIPFDAFVNMASTIKPRYYSVACSPKLSPNHLELSISLGAAGEAKGVSVSFFQSLLQAPGEDLKMNLLRIYQTPSRFRIPPDRDAPMVMVSNGVGVSPMRGLLQERHYEISRDSKDASFKPPCNALYFGCPNRSSILFEEDFRSWEAKGTLLLRLAFSAQEGEKSVYVQDIVALHLDEIFTILATSASSRLYICGRSEMSRKVRQVFQKDKRNWPQGSDAHEASSFSTWFEDMNHSGRYIEEIWG